MREPGGTAGRPVRYPIPRALAQLDAGRHLVVEASAGTGKTFFIEHRVVDLLVRGEATIDQILVVTFTEKATAELRARIRHLIEKVAAADRPEAGPDAGDRPAWTIGAAERRLLGDALASFDRATISTIHAFCQRVLTDHAFTGGRLLRQTRVDGDAAFGAAFRTALRGRLARDDHDRLLLAEWLASGHTIDGLSCATAYLPSGALQSRPFPAPGPFAHAAKSGATPPMMNFGAVVAKRESRHQPRPPSMSEYIFPGLSFGSSLPSGPRFHCANIHVPNSPDWKCVPG